MGSGSLGDGAVLSASKENLPDSRRNSSKTASTKVAEGPTAVSTTFPASNQTRPSVAPPTTCSSPFFLVAASSARTSGRAKVSSVPCSDTVMTSGQPDSLLHRQVYP